MKKGRRKGRNRVPSSSLFGQLLDGKVLSVTVLTSWGRNIRSVVPGLRESTKLLLTQVCVVYEYEH